MNNAVSHVTAYSEKLLALEILFFSHSDYTYAWEMLISEPMYEDSHSDKQEEATKSALESKRKLK